LTLDHLIILIWLIEEWRMVILQVVFVLYKYHQKNTNYYYIQGIYTMVLHII